MWACSANLQIAYVIAIKLGALMELQRKLDDTFYVTITRLCSIGSVRQREKDRYLSNAFATEHSNVLSILYNLALQTTCLPFTFTYVGGLIRDIGICTKYEASPWTKIQLGYMITTIIITVYQPQDLPIITRQEELLR